MITFEDARSATNRWERIDLGERGSFEILIGPPTLADQLQAAAIEVGRVSNEVSQGENYRHRIRATVRGWVGVRDADGNEVEFSVDRLLSLAFQTGCIMQLVALAYAEFRPADHEAEEARAKNSEEPSANASDAAAQPTIQELVSTPASSDLLD